MNDKDTARESNDSSVSNVQSVEKSPETHNRVEAHPKMHPPHFIVSYRPLLSFVADLYFGAPLFYAALAKVDSVLSFH